MAAIKEESLTLDPTQDEELKFVFDSLTHPFEPERGFDWSENRHEEYFWLLLRNNLRATALIALMGSLVFVVPGIPVTGLGFLLGHLVVLDGGLRFAQRLLPHGVFEIPAALTIAAVSMQTGWAFLVAPFGRKWTTYKAHLPLLAKTWLAVTAAIVLAAFLEAYGRAYLWSHFGSG